MPDRVQKKNSYLSQSKHNKSVIINIILTYFVDVILQDENFKSTSIYNSVRLKLSFKH